MWKVHIYCNLLRYYCSECFRKIIFFKVTCIAPNIQYGDCEASCSHICISVHLLIYCILHVVIIYAVMIIVSSFFYVLEVLSLKCFQCNYKPSF